MTQLKPALRLKSAVCSGEVMIVKCAGTETLTCGGAPMLAPGESANGAEADAAHMEGCQIGKRYVNADESLEVLCVKPGQGSLAADGQALTVKGAKKLPSSD
jgi:hypothetical protein